jgi:hypothetical protein
MSIVRDRLEKMRDQPRKVAPALRDDEMSSNTDKVLLSPETVFMRKVEKSMKIIDSLKKKMHGDSGQYLSLYYDLKRAEKDFLEAVENSDIEYLDIPHVFLQKVDKYKESIKR